MLITLFRSAGATGHVFLLKNGRVADKGIAYSGFIGPQTTVALVPTVPQVLDFAVDARTRDKQDVTITGDLKVVFVPPQAVAKFDFTVDPKTGAYQTAWEAKLHSFVVAHILAPIHEKARTLSVEEATVSHKGFEEAIEAHLRAAGNPLAAMGVTFMGTSVVSIEAEEEVAEAIGAEERVALLTEADRAVHGRRIEASRNERAIKTFEAKTALNLEKERSKLLAEQGRNKKTEAEADAEATAIKLQPLKDADSGKILGAALMKMAETGRVGNLSIVPEMLAALQQK